MTDQTGHSGGLHHPHSTTSTTGGMNGTMHPQHGSGMHPQHGASGTMGSTTHIHHEPMLNVEQFKRLRELNMQYKELDNRLQKFDKEIYEKIYFEVFPQLRNNNNNHHNALSGGHVQHGGGVVQGGMMTSGGGGTEGYHGGVHPPSNYAVHQQQQQQQLHHQHQLQQHQHQQQQQHYPPAQPNANYMTNRPTNAFYNPTSASNPPPAPSAAEAKGVDGMHIPHVKPDPHHPHHPGGSHAADSKPGTLSFNPNAVKKSEGSHIPSAPSSSAGQTMPGSGPKAIQKAPAPTGNTTNVPPNTSNNAQTIAPPQATVPPPALTWQVCDAMFTIGQSNPFGIGNDGRIPMPPAVSTLFFLFFFYSS